MRALKLTLLVFLLFSSSLFAQFGRGGDNRFGGSGSFGRGSDVVVVNSAPTIDAISDTTIAEAELLSLTPTASDVDGPIPTLSILNAPAGSNFMDNGDGTGTFTWTPTYSQAGGVYVPSFVASDGILTDITTFTITVNNTNRAPVIAAIADTTFGELVAYTWNVTATDADGDAITLSCLDLPTGATFVDNGGGDGDFDWTPMLDQAAVYTPSFVASDGVLTDTVTVTITVTDVPAFQFTVKTDNAGTSAADQFLMPMVGIGLDCYVDWGDGSAVEHVTTADLPKTHTFVGGAGTYTCAVTGTLKGWQFNDGGDKLKLTGISEWDVFDISTTAGFYGCTNLVISATDAPSISATDLTNYFRDCAALTSIGDATGWIIAAITDFTSFLNGSAFSQANYDILLPDWNTQSHQSGVSFHAGTAKYSLEASNSRAELVDDTWTITDGGSEMGAGLTYYWRGDYGITDDGVNVDSWEDMLTGLVANSSGDGLTLTTLGGEVAVLGDNSQCLQTAAIGTITEPLSIWIVTKTSTNVGTSKVTLALKSGIGTTTKHGDSWSDIDDYFLHGTLTLNLGTPIAGQEEYRLIVFEESVNVDKLYVDGIQVISGNAGVGSIDIISMFAEVSKTLISDCSIAEVGIMSGAATTAQKAILHDYMESRYGLTVADLP